MGKNKGQETVQMYRWDQYNERWIPFTGSVGPNGRVYVEVIDKPPTDSTKVNPSLVLSNVDPVVSSTKTITKIIGSNQYLKTLSLNAGGDVIQVSAWSEI